MSELRSEPLEDYEWREYDFEVSPGVRRVYRIEKPVRLFFRPGGTTHRIVDAEGVVHIVPAPGNQGCVVRYKKTEGAEFVKF